MAAANTFDITSTIDMQEVDNAINQARKEIAQRFDFKGSPAAIDLDVKENTLTISAEDKFRIEAVWEILSGRMVRRNVAVKNLKRGEIETAAGGTSRQVITLQQGIPIEAAREIVKHLKELKLKKVQAAIQGDQLRLSSPAKDELQAAMQALRAKEFGIALQFGNYRS
jgi:cyclic-di-GMP-binding protein